MSSKYKVEIQDVKHGIKVSLPMGGIYSFPKRCTCCLSPTDNTMTIESSKKVAEDYSTVTYEKTSLDVPLCKECKAHQRAGCLLIPLLWIGFTFITTSIFLLISRIAENQSSVPSIVSISGNFLIILPIVLFIVYRKRWWPKKHPGHARVSRPVKKSEDGKTFIFYNREYGRLFAEANITMFRKIENELK